MATHEDLPYVVVCILSDSEKQTLDLYKPRYADQSEYTPVQEASVILKEHDKKVADFQYNGERWVCLFTPEYGHTYSINITIAGKQLITAETKMPDKVRLFEFKTYSQNSSGINEELQSVFYQFRTEGKIMEHGTIIRDTSFRYNGECNVWLYPIQEFDYISKSCISLNKFIATNHINADKFNINGNNALYMIENDVKSYYGKEYQWLQNTFPNIPVYNKFLHINHPASYDNQNSSHTPHKSCFCLSTEDYFSRYIDFSFIGSTEPPHIEKTDDWVFQTLYVSDELDMFYRDMYIQELERENITSVFKNNNAYTNINGGIGVFGAEVMNISTSGTWTFSTE